MPPYNAGQRERITQFTEYTGVKESSAAKYLKASAWDVQAAINSYYSSSNTRPPATSNCTALLNTLFDHYRDDPNEADLIGPTGTMSYLTDLDVPLDEPIVLAVLTETSAPTMGELSRKGFVDGWAARSADDLAKQQAAVTEMRDRLQTDATYFRRVYRYTFTLARAPGQKSVALDTAVDFWRLLFGPTGWSWKSSAPSPSADQTAKREIDWLDAWTRFVTERWRKSVGKDMWDQTEVFAQKCLADGSLEWWDEEQSWPGVLDDFALFMREKIRAGGSEPESMDME